ncbi:MAG: DinB family protein [Chloroflexaceae bacterium]|jgi:rubrerythrin|nr:DinB family protein [Chloroflexaceae bacterium]
MTGDELELRRMLCSTSLGYTAYHVWAQQARKERRYNIARLLEASSNVKRIRAERAFRALGEVGTTAKNIARALAGLEPDTVATGPVTGTSAISRELMSRAARALADNRDLRADELGDLYVCGSCGEMMEGTPPTVCRVCGTVVEGFLPFRAAEAMGTMGPHSIVWHLERAEILIRALVERLPDDMLARRPVSGHSIKELLGHLTDMDVVFRERAWLILETDEPELSLAHPPTLAKASVYQNVPLNELLNNFHASRTQTLALLRGLTSAAWHRTGRHAVQGTIPLLHQGNWVVSHERAHMVEMAQLRHDMLAGDAQFAPAGLPIQLVPEILEGE